MKVLVATLLLAAQAVPDRLYDPRVDSPVVYGLVDGITWGVLRPEPYGRAPEILPAVSAAGWPPAVYEARLIHTAPIYHTTTWVGRGLTILFAGGLLWLFAKRWRRQRFA